MNVLFVLIPISLLMAAGFVTACLWAIHKEQYRDLESPRWRILFDEASRFDETSPFKETHSFDEPPPFNKTHPFDESKVQGNIYGKN